MQLQLREHGQPGLCHTRHNWSSLSSPSTTAQTLAEKMTRLPVDYLLSGDSHIYNLNVSLVSDFLAPLTPENMNVTYLVPADTDEGDLFGNLEVFELPHYGVKHIVGELEKIKVRTKLTLHGTFVIDDTQTVEDDEYEETVKEKRKLPAEAKSLIASFSTMSNDPDPLTYEAPEANVYEFHLSGIIDMLEKLQKKFNAELHDAQEGESNVAHASSMKVQNLTDAVANVQAGISRSMEIISPLKQILIQGKDGDITTLTDNLKNIDKAIRMIKQLVDKLLEQVNDEATQKDWCLTELSKNEQSRPTLADDESNLKNMENPTMHFAVLSKVKDSIRMIALTQVEEEKDDVIERNIIELDETSLKGNVRTDEKQND